jgi:hypothetical protein
MQCVVGHIPRDSSFLFKTNGLKSLAWLGPSFEYHMSIWVQYLKFKSNMVNQHDMVNTCVWVHYRMKKEEKKNVIFILNLINITKVPQNVFLIW